MLKTWLRRWLALEEPRSPAREEVVSRLELLEHKVELVESRWRTWRTEAETYLDAVGEVLDQVEHKRRQTASSAARAARGPGAGRESAEAAPGAPQQETLESLMARDPEAARGAILRAVRSRRG